MVWSIRPPRPVPRSLIDCQMPRRISVCSLLKGLSSTGTAYHLGWPTVALAGGQARLGLGPFGRLVNVFVSVIALVGGIVS